MQRVFRNLGILVLFCLLLDNQEAQAYINPGSGSYIFQTVIGGVLGIFYFIKKIVLRLLGKANNNDE